MRVCGQRQYTPRVSLCLEPQRRTAQRQGRHGQSIPLAQPDTEPRVDLYSIDRLLYLGRIDSAEDLMRE